MKRMNITFSEFLKCLSCEKRVSVFIERGDDYIEKLADQETVISLYISKENLVKEVIANKYADCQVVGISYALGSQLNILIS